MTTSLAATAPRQVGARAAQRALILSERSLLLSLRSTVRIATAHSVASIATLHQRDPRARAEAAIAVLADRAPTLIASLAHAIQVGRLGAKRHSLQRLSSEWEAVRAAVTKAGHADPGPLTYPATLKPTDRAAASASSASLGAAWLTATSAAVWTAPAPEDLPAAVTRAADEQDYRTRRTATTEAARAFADARDEGMGWQAEQHADRAWMPLILKTWDATLDARVCPRCARLAGTTRPWGIPFPGGLEPGYVHPGCRCLTGTLILPIPSSVDATVPGYAVDDEHHRAA